MMGARTAEMILRNSICAMFLVAGLSLSMPKTASSHAQGFSEAGQPVVDVFFSDSSDGWIVVSDPDRYHLLYTSDAGNTWSERTIPEGTSRTFFVDENTGWALVLQVRSKDNASTYLFRTRDGGRTWKQTQKMPFARCDGEKCALVSGMAFSDSFHGWLIGEESAGVAGVWETSDGGKSIRQLKETCIPDLPRGVYANNDGRVWIFGNYFILSSSDNGKTWKDQMKSSGLLTKRPVLILESGIGFENGAGWAAGQNATGTILSTHDFGDHWKVALESEALTTFMALSFSDREHGCAVGTSPLLFCTADGGQTWNQKDVLPKRLGTQSVFFDKVIILKNGRGWVLRRGGYLYETRDAGLTWRECHPLQEFVGTVR